MRNFPKKIVSLDAMPRPKSQKFAMCLRSRCLLFFAVSLSYSARLPLDAGSSTNWDTGNLAQPSVPNNKTWERVSIPGPGQNPLPYSIICDAKFGAGAEARSCFNALDFAPRGEEQETWVKDGAIPPGIQNPVRLPLVVVSSKSFVLSCSPCGL